MPTSTLKRSTGESEIYYPDSDGLPMADSDTQRKTILNLIHSLETRYAEEPDVYVSGNLLIYYVEGDPNTSIDPDAFVVPGAGKRDRDNYLLWEEGLVPAIAFETVSKTNWPRVLQEKKDVYESLGIEEEEREARIKAEAQAAQEAAARRTAEEELARLRAEIERLKKASG